MIQQVTLRSASDPIEKAVEGMLATFPGDVSMILASLSRNTLAGDLDAFEIMAVVWGLPVVLSRPILMWLRNTVVHPQEAQPVRDTLREQAARLAAAQIDEQDSCPCEDCFKLLAEDILDDLLHEQGE
jgi:hypothetical protein